MLAPFRLTSGFENATSTLTSPSPKDDVVNARGHLPALDALRGLAILAVTAYRFREVPTDNTVLDAVVARGLNLGDRGVDLFFVLSGFLITGILFDAKGREHYFRNFYIRRGLRIWPLYIAVLIVGLVILPRLLAGTTSAFANPPEHSLWLWLHLSNWIMSWENAWLFPTFNHFWSLAVEEQFYLVWPLLIWGLSRRGAMWLCGGCAAISLALRTWLTLIDYAHPSTDIFTLCRLDALAAGSWIALYVRGPHSAAWLNRLTPWLLVGGVSLTLITMRSLKLLASSAPTTGKVLHDNSYFWTALACAGLLLVALRPHTGLRQRFWHHPWLQAAGKYSYGWYVFQGMLQPDFMTLGVGAAIAGWTGSAVLGRFGQILLGGGISLLLAILSWRLFESRFLQLKDRLAPSKN